MIIPFEKVIREFMDDYDMKAEEYKLKGLGSIRRKYDQDRFDKEKNQDEVKQEVVDGVKALFKKEKIYDFDKTSETREIGDKLEERIMKNF